jgi:hypothetical protein
LRKIKVDYFLLGFRDERGAEPYAQATFAHLSRFLWLPRLPRRGLRLSAGGRCFRVGLHQPLRATGVAYPYGEGVVVEGLDLGAFGLAGEAAEDVICSDRRVRSEDADLEVAQFVRSEPAVFKEDEGGIECLNAVVDPDVVGGEEAADGTEIAFCKGRPEVLLLCDDFDGLHREVRCLGANLGKGRHREKEEEGAHENHVIAFPLDLYVDGCSRMALPCLCTGCRGFVANVADGGVDDRVEERVVVGFGLHLDVVAHALAGCGVVGEGNIAVLRGNCGKLLDDVEEGCFVLASELPAIGDGAGEDLLGGPVVRCGIAGAVDGGWRLCGNRDGCGREGEAEKVKLTDLAN